MKNLLHAPTLWLWLLTFVLGVGASQSAWAQLPSTAVVDPDMTRPMTDTARVAKPLTKQQKREQAAADSALRTERLFGLRLTRTKKAMLLAIAPGAGQIYNKKYWKLPLVYGLLGTLGYAEFFYEVRYLDYRDAKARIAEKGTSVLGTDALRRAKIETTTTGIESGLVFYRRNRDLYVLVLAGGFALQMLDAVVDANLHDFDVGKDLSLRWQPALLPIPGQLLPGVGASVALRVK
jgi:hypothetical protein